MTKVTTEQIKSIAKDAKQSADGQFSQGSDSQQHAAKYTEEFLLSYDDIAHRVNEPEYSEFCAAAINALRDLQVRDYIMGIMNEDNANTFNHALNYLVTVAPDEYSAPVDTLLALTYYELNDTDMALELLAEPVSKDYPLASLLTRVFQAGWSKESFQEMRNELHPKVCAVIFGEDE